MAEGLRFLFAFQQTVHLHETKYEGSSLHTNTYAVRSHSYINYKRCLWCPLFTLQCAGIVNEKLEFYTTVYPSAAKALNARSKFSSFTRI